MRMISADTPLMMGKGNWYIKCCTYLICWGGGPQLFSINVTTNLSSGRKESNSNSNTRNNKQSIEGGRKGDAEKIISWPSLISRTLEEGCKGSYASPWRNTWTTISLWVGVTRVLGDGTAATVISHEYLDWLNKHRIQKRCKLWGQVSTKKTRNCHTVILYTMCWWYE